MWLYIVFIEVLYRTKRNAKDEYAYSVSSKPRIPSSDVPLLICRNVHPQSSIATFEPLCEVQSNKTSVEITSRYEGTVKEIFVGEGQVAKVGEGLCIIEVDDEASNP